MVERIVGGKVALIQPRIRANQTTPEWYIKEKGADSWRGWTNRDLVGEGYAPFSWPTIPGTEEGVDQMELHHIGQRQNSPYAELTKRQHMCDGHNTILHISQESEIDRVLFDKERSNYWQNRYYVGWD